MKVEILAHKHTHNPTTDNNNMTITVEMKRYNYLTDNNRQHLTAAQKQVGEITLITEYDDIKRVDTFK